MTLEQYDFTSLDHMTHVNNLDTIFKYGLQAHGTSYKKVDISNHEVNNRRESRENIYGRKIHDYVPFYFNPRNAMMYKNRNEDVVILAFDKKLLLNNNVLFTDKNASTDSVHFYKNLDDLDKIKWNFVKSDSWYDKAPIVKQVMMAEVLVYKNVSISYLKGIYVKNETTKNMLMKRYNLPSRKIAIKPNLFFKY
jgi:hypothetical protein